MKNIIGYGSLLNPEETDFDLDRQQPVKIRGFRRVFNQETTHRFNEGKEGRAVLNVEKDSESWINAVVISDLDKEELERMKDRESGYRFVKAEEEKIEPYADSGALDIEGNTYIFIGEWTSEEIKPIKSYVKICLEGARFWRDKIIEENPGAEDFYRDFIRTTYLVEGSSLEEDISGIE